MYAVLVTAFVAFSLSAGYMAGTQPPGAGWRFFSWHPFLMTCGMMGLFGTGILTKKLKGYTNTKVKELPSVRHCSHGPSLTQH